MNRHGLTKTTTLLNVTKTKKGGCEIPEQQFLSSLSPTEAPPYFKRAARGSTVILGRILAPLNSAPLRPFPPLLEGPSLTVVAVVYFQRHSGV